MVLQFAAETDRDLLSDQLKARLSDIERVRRAAATSGAGPGGGGGGKQNKTKAGGGPAPVSTAELAARASLLQSNVELAELHARLVKGSGTGADKDKDGGGGDLGISGAVITEEEFWAARQHLFKGAMANTVAAQKPGIANALDSD